MDGGWIRDSDEGWPKEAQALKPKVLEAWDAIPLESFRELVRSYRVRLQVIHSVDGDRHPQFAWVLGWIGDGFLMFLYINKFEYMFIPLMYNINNIKNSFYTVFELMLHVHMVIHHLKIWKSVISLKLQVYEIDINKQS